MTGAKSLHTILHEQVKLDNAQSGREKGETLLPTFYFILWELLSGFHRFRELVKTHSMSFYCAFLCNRVVKDKNYISRENKMAEE